LTMQSKTQYKIFLVDDHPIFLKGVASVINLQEDFSVCGQALSARSAMDQISRINPDVVILDISMPGVSGIELIQQIRKHHSRKIPIMVLSMHDDPSYVKKVLEAGGDGFLSKSKAPDEIINALHQILNGDIFVDLETQNDLIKVMAKANSKIEDPRFSVLTAREWEIFQLLGQALESKDISKKLFIAVKTVNTHKRNIQIKLKLSSHLNLVELAIKNALQRQNPFIPFGSSGGS